MKSINEILGTIAGSGHGHARPPMAREFNEPLTGGPTNFAGINEAQPLCQQMRPWQRGVYATLLNGSDAYIAASPGGGKTLPYICYWLDYVLKLNVSGVRGDTQYRSFSATIYKLFVRPDTLDKMLIMVPTRSLADQTVREFKEYFSKILVQTLNLFLSNAIPNIVNNDPNVNLNVQREIIDAIDPDINTLITSRANLYRRLSSEQAARMHDARLVRPVPNPPVLGQSEHPNDLRDPNDQHIAQQIDQIDTQINELVGAGIKEILDDLRVNNKSLICLRTGLNNMGDPKNAPVSIAIYESAGKLINDIKKQLKLVVTDESHLAQEREIQDDSRRSTIALSLYEVLKALKGQADQTRFCFLSGTENPSSAYNLAKYLKQCFNRNIEVVESSAKNESNISIVPDDSIKQERALIDIILRPKQSSNLIVLFSKMMINRLTENALKKTGRTTSHQIDRGERKPYEFGGGTIGRKFSGFSKSPNSRYEMDKNTRQNVAREASKVPGASQIYDPVLRQAVNAGFGYIYRVDSTLSRDEQRVLGNDAVIVANLFKAGKIKTLLATDAVGIGVNIDVKTLFIPNINKPQGGSFKPMPETELSQLLNRAGRGAFKFSTVVTPSENVPAVSNALSMGLDNFEDTVTIEYMPRFACASSKWFKSLWSATTGAVAAGYRNQRRAL